MKRRIFDLLLLLGTLAILGVVVVVSGIFPVQASFGHLPGVAWLLDFASGRSIATYSTGIKVPPLDDPGLVRLGAVSYQSNCQWCHGSPLEPTPVVAAHMLPAPPYLPNVIHQWEPEELFTIVKHGIKFAGMPAWPTQRRDEEVWAVVAFLLQFPQLEHDQYAEIFGLSKTASDPQEPGSGTTQEPSSSQLPRGDVAVWKQCQLCHGGQRGSPVHTLVPALAGQSADYLRNAMQTFISGERQSGMMQPIASRLSPEEIEEWVAFYSASQNSEQHQPPSSAASLSEESANIGETLVFQGDRTTKIPSCVDCHGPAQEPRRPDYPRLSGQPAEYLETQLQHFAAGIRFGPRADIMRTIARKLTPEQKRAVAEFYQQLPVDNPNSPEQHQR